MTTVDNGGITVIEIWDSIAQAPRGIEKPVCCRAPDATAQVATALHARAQPGQRQKSAFRASPLHHRRMDNRLDFLPDHLRGSARVERNGEVAWPASDAVAVVDAMAGAGLVVLGLDLRRYDAEGGVFELSWSAFSTPSSTSTAAEAHAAARYALGRPDRPADLDWVLVTWAQPPL